MAEVTVRYCRYSLFYSHGILLCEESWRGSSSSFDRGGSDLSKVPGFSLSFCMAFSFVLLPTCRYDHSFSSELPKRSLGCWKACLPPQERELSNLAFPE